jgi:hypothetical protein
LPGPEEQGTQRCFKCHGDSQITSMTAEALAGMVRVPLDRAPVFRSAEEIARLLVPSASFEASAHGRMQCTECHTGVSTLPHDQQQSTKSCQDCHTTATVELAQGPHRNDIQDGRERPDCAGCHGHYHTLRSLKQPRSYESALTILDMCTTCHIKTDMPRADQTQRYADTIHGSTLIEKGLAQAPTCVECHGNTTPSYPPIGCGQPGSPRRAPDYVRKNAMRESCRTYREASTARCCRRTKRKRPVARAAMPATVSEATDRSFSAQHHSRVLGATWIWPDVSVEFPRQGRPHLGRETRRFVELPGHHDIQRRKIRARGSMPPISKRRARLS